MNSIFKYKNLQVGGKENESTLEMVNLGSMHVEFNFFLRLMHIWPGDSKSIAIAKALGSIMTGPNNPFCLLMLFWHCCPIVEVFFCCSQFAL